MPALLVLVLGDAQPRSADGTEKLDAGLKPGLHREEARGNRPENENAPIGVGA
jgi:hypothetical protein